MEECTEKAILYSTDESPPQDPDMLTWWYPTSSFPDSEERFSCLSSTQSREVAAWRVRVRTHLTRSLWEWGRQKEDWRPGKRRADGVGERRGKSLFLATGWAPLVGEWLTLQATRVSWEMWKGHLMAVSLSQGPIRNPAGHSVDTGCPCSEGCPV